MLGLGVLSQPLWSQQEPSVAKDKPEPSFAKDIKPFLDKYCLECHKGKGGKGGFDVTSHATVKKGGISFPGFIAGNPKESFMLELVEARSAPVMPPKKSKQPTADEKKKLRDWIAAGAKP